jgi:hypothetical protein
MCFLTTSKALDYEIRQLAPEDGFLFCEKNMRIFLTVTE